MGSGWRRSCSVTGDFDTFHFSQLSGTAATDKGMALFPRPVGGRALALSRHDRESNSLAESDDGVRWRVVTTLQAPQHPWELVQLGNCGSPMETRDGWLVLTHGVGPMREYSIGALLLDLEDPSKVIGWLDEPLLTPTADEREVRAQRPLLVRRPAPRRHARLALRLQRRLDQGRACRRTQLLTRLR